MDKSKPAPKKAVAKTKAKRRRQMTAALAEKHAVGWKDGRKIDIVAFLRDLR